MKIPNGFFGNGPGRDEQNTRDQEAYMRNRMQMTVATSTFAGVALVGMFCSCIWFACCRNSSSKTRKKPRTWATANPEAGLQNPYNYDGYMDGEGYMQMNNEGCAAPYVSNSLYPPGPVYGDNGLTNAYDFNDHFGFNQGGKGQMSTLFGGPASNYAAPVTTGTAESNLKDVPPSYTALFFAASDPSTGMSGKGMSASGDGQSSTNSTDPRVTNIQPIHLKVTSSAEQEKRQGAQQEVELKQGNKRPEKHGFGFDEDEMEEDFLNINNQRDAPVSLVSVDSDPGKESKDEHQENKPSNTDVYSVPEEKRENPPPYNPGFNFNSTTPSYMKF